MTDARYLVLKGVAGLGDRLMTLARALQYAALTKRTLIIDWAGDSWNHNDPPKGFWHYLDLVNLPSSISVVRGDAETYALLDRLSADGAYTAPVGFQGNLRRLDWSLDPQTRRLVLEGKNVQLTHEEILQNPAPVVIYLGYCAGRLEDVMPFLQLRPICQDARYKIGVHFRNTDKANNLEAAVARVAQVWQPGYSIYLATDDCKAIQAFKDKFGDDVHYTMPPPRPANGGGIHHCVPAELASVGLTKERLNEDMLRDVIRLRDCVLFLGCPNSLFSRVVETARAFRLKR